jgi:hypothetical protein
VAKTRNYKIAKWLSEFSSDDICLELCSSLLTLDNPKASF